LYSGDGCFLAGSGALSQQVNQAGTTTNVGSSAAPSVSGQAVTFTATVTVNAPGSTAPGYPTGTVTFKDGSTVLGSGTLSTSGGVTTASFTTSALTGGTHTITATYAGDTNFLGSAGTFTQVVVPILVLDPTASGALTLSGNAGIKTAGAVIVDSNSKTALTASGNASLKAASILIVGGYQKSGNASLSPTPVTGAAYVPDPLAAYLSTPLPGGMTNYGTANIGGNSSVTLSPGIYSQITISGKAQVTFQPGLYVIQGGGFADSGNASVTGTGVTIDNTADPKTGTYGSIQLSGNGSFSLSAPTSATAADPFAGVVLFQPAGNTRALSISGNAAAGLTGTVLAPSAQLAMSGNATFNGALVVDTLTLSGNVIANAVSLTSPSGSVAYSPAQIRTAYGISGPGLDGTGQTVAIVVAYDDPAIYQSLDAFDSQFGVAATGKSLYEQYGPASAFLTVLNQSGQTTNLPATDPAGPGAANWEAEAALDVEWVHAIAPGAQIVLVGANSQSLADLMAGVATAAAQPGVSVVSMSWGFAAGQDVLAADEAAYDGTFVKPGVTFVASTGDYGTADPEYPAFSPNVVAVGGTTLNLNADGSYNSETGWGYQSAAYGSFIGSGGGISLYEPEPAYQQGVQSTGGRTTPDVSMLADPATGAWVADPYNLPAANPFEVVGGTSLSAPCWAGLLALVNQGRVAAGQATLNSASPTGVQQALYALPQRDYNVIASGYNGYSAGPGYNLLTGLGSPVANLLVPDLVAYQGPGSLANAGPTVAPIQAAGLVNSGVAGPSDAGPTNAFSVFDFAVASSGPVGRGGIGMPVVEAVLAHPLARDWSTAAAAILAPAVRSPVADMGTAAAASCAVVDEDIGGATAAEPASGTAVGPVADTSDAAIVAAPRGHVLHDPGADVDALFAQLAANGDLGSDGSARWFAVLSQERQAPWAPRKG
jgi:hypothetical protein